MIRKYIKTLIPSTILCLAPIIAGLALWNRIPERVPIHFGPDGAPDEWGSKVIAIFVMPLFFAAIEWLCCLITGTDPKANKINTTMMKLMLWFIPALSILVSTIIYMTALDKGINAATLVPGFLGLMFILIGNYMPKCQQNYTMGIKIPWTLNSTENWNRTHRFAGRLWLAAGIIVVMTSFLGKIYVFLAVLIAATVIPVIYSYILYKKGI